MEVLSRAGFDFVILDCEHGPLSIVTLKGLIIACNGSGIVSIVRIKQNYGPAVTEPLDAGALGVQVPHISSSQAASNAIAFAKYHPMGERGVNPYVRAAGYSPEGFSSFIEWANENTLVVPQVEGVEGVANVDGILDVAGVDIIFLGPYDLSQSLGIPGEVHNPAVIQKMQEVISKAQKKGIVVGTFADNEKAAQRWIDLGVRYIAVSYDTKMLLDRATEVVSSLKK